MENRCRHVVDVRDVGEALILVYEKAEAEGRYICTSRLTSYRELVEILRKHYPNYKYPKRWSCYLCWWLNFFGFPSLFHYFINFEGGSWHLVELHASIYIYIYVVIIEMMVNGCSYYGWNFGADLKRWMRRRCRNRNLVVRNWRGLGGNIGRLKKQLWTLLRVTKSGDCCWLDQTEEFI